MFISVRLTATKLGNYCGFAMQNWHLPWHENSVIDPIWRRSRCVKVSVSDILALSEQRKAVSKLRAMKPYRATSPCAKSRFCGIAHQLKAALLHYSRNNHLFKTFSGNPTALDSCRLGYFSVYLILPSSSGSNSPNRDNSRAFPTERQQKHVHKTGPEKQKGLSRLYLIWDSTSCFLEFQAPSVADDCKLKYCPSVAGARIQGPK